MHLCMVVPCALLLYANTTVDASESPPVECGAMPNSLWNASLWFAWETIEVSSMAPAIIEDVEWVCTCCLIVYCGSVLCMYDLRTVNCMWYFCSFVVEDCNPYSELWTTRIQLLLRVMCGLPVSMALITSFINTTVIYICCVQFCLYM